MSGKKSRNEDDMRKDMRSNEVLDKEKIQETRVKTIDGKIMIKIRNKEKTQSMR